MSGLRLSVFSLWKKVECFGLALLRQAWEVGFKL